MRTLSSFFTACISFLENIRNIGDTDQLDYLKRNELRMSNIIALFSILIVIIYGAINLNKFPVVGILNFASVGFLLVVFLLNARQKYMFAKLWLLFSLLSLCAVVNLLIPHVATFYLLCALTAGLMVFHARWVQFILIVFVSIAITAPNYIQLPVAYIVKLSGGRMLFNSVFGICCLSALIIYIQYIQRQYQKKIVKQNSYITGLNNDLKNLFAVIAHDFLSPLQSSHYVLDKIKSKELQGEEKEIGIEQISRQVFALQDNLKGILEWSRHNLEGLQPQPQKINLASFSQAIIDSVEDRYILKNIRFELDIPLEFNIYADPVHMGIVFRNILDNAWKFSFPNSTISICARSTGKEIQYIVSDQGLGIPQELLDGIFSRFNQPRFGTSGERGSGLGLVLVKRLLKANKGAIVAESSLNQGTSMTIYMPHRPL